MKDWNKKIEKEKKREAKFQKIYFGLYYILGMWNLHLSIISHEGSFLDGVGFGIKLFINNLSLIDI
jgi:hypothetical protein